MSLKVYELLDGDIELDRRYFGGERKEKRGRVAAGKIAVFDILKHDGKVYTKVVINTKTETLMPLVTRKIAPTALLHGLLPKLQHLGCQ